MAIHRKILRWLENELFEGNIQLGQDLPSDSEIARAIGVSRSRTREALRTLEDMDLVQLYNGRGKEMLVHLSDEPAAAASAALRLHMSSSRYPTRDLVQTRILLESWAIARIDPKTASFAEMDEVLEQMEDFDLSIRDFLELLLTFHHQVMRCGGNELLVGLLASVRQPSFESMLSLVGRMPLWSSAVERLRAESRAIAEALKAGDAATARAMVIGQLRGMYSDAGIDLEQEATSANGLPGEPIASEFAPVDVDEFAADDFEADDFDDLMQDDLSFADVGALPAADAPVAAPAEPAPVPAQSADVEYEQSESEAAPVEAATVEETASDIPSELADTSAETTTGANVSASDKMERSNPAASQPAPTAASVAAAHSVSPDVPLSFATPRRSTPIAQATPAASAAPVSAVQSSASQTLSSQTPSGQLQSVPAAYTQEGAEGPAKVLRASTAAPRRRSGQIISPVRATIIKPVDRSKVLTTPAATARPATVVTAAAPAEPEPAEKVLRAPARQEAPATEPAEPTRLEAAATIHDTYEKLPHEEPVQERRGIFSKMKRFFGVDVYEPEHDEAQESPDKDQAVKEQALKAETKPESQPEPQPVIVEEALARAEAERAERLKGLHTAAEEEIAEEEAAEENAVEEVSVEEPLEEPAEASDPAQESAEESVETVSSAEKSTHDAAVASSGSVLSHGRAKGSKKSKKKRR